MFKYDPRLCRPPAEELPDSDDTPVDNELQDLIPGLLKGYKSQPPKVSRQQIALS